MQNLRRMFTDSAKELKSIRTLAITAVFIALNVTMDLLNIRIQLMLDLRIGFGFVCNAMVGMLFGPVVAMSAGFATDVLGYLVNTGGAAYFPGFTVTAVLGGLVWGMMLYKQQVTVWRAICAKGIINLFLNTGLNSVWMCLFYGSAMKAILPVRFLKNIAILPLEVFLLVLVGGVVSTAVRRLKVPTAV